MRTPPQTSTGLRRSTFLFDTAFRWKPASGKTAAFVCIQTGRIPTRRPKENKIRGAACVSRCPGVLRSRFRYPQKGDRSSPSSRPRFYKTLTSSLLPVYAHGFLLKLQGRLEAHGGSDLGTVPGFVRRSGVIVSTFMDVRWFLLVAGVTAVCFLSWVLLNFSRDRIKKRERDSGIYARRRGKGGIWE